MKHPKPKDVDAYIADQAEQALAILKGLRKVIKSTVQKAVERIRWEAPFYNYHGFLAGFAAYKRHVRFGIVGDTREKAVNYTLLPVFWNY